MPAPFSGGCACGAIRYSSAGEPVYMGNCHCRDCQHATGGGHLAAVAVKADDFTLESGEPAWYESKADRGHMMRRGFCAACGSPLFLENGAGKGAIVLFAGSLDDPSRYQPSRDIYVASAQPWDIMHPDIPKDERRPEHWK